MRIKPILLVLMLATSLNAQKVTKILHKDTTRYSKNGINYKRLAHRMIIEGVYNGKDLYMSNGFGKDGIGYCVTELKVNGNYTADEINASVFRVDLGVHKLKLGEKFTITMVYKDSCMGSDPLMMNQGVIKERDPSGNNTLIVEGTNYNGNLQVLNPRSGKGYGIKEVTVNGKKVENIAADVFEIPFYKLKIPYQEKIKIEFKYEGDCDPFIINPEVINY